MMQTESIQPATQLFQIRSTVRSVQTRTQRYAAPVAIRRVQFILDTQQRLVPGRHITVSESDVKRNLEHLKEREALGICTVHAPDGRKLDLSTFTFAESMVESPAPKFREDSVANDLKPGETRHLQYAPGPDTKVEEPVTPSEVAQVDVLAVSNETPEQGHELGLGEEATLLANPDFAPEAPELAPMAEAEDEEAEDIPLPKPISSGKKKNKR